MTPEQVRELIGLTERIHFYGVLYNAYNLMPERKKALDAEASLEHWMRKTEKLMKEMLEQ